MRLKKSVFRLTLMTTKHFNAFLYMLSPCDNRCVRPIFEDHNIKLLTWKIVESWKLTFHILHPKEVELPYLCVVTVPREMSQVRRLWRNEEDITDKNLNYKQLNYKIAKQHLE